MRVGVQRRVSVHREHRQWLDEYTNTTKNFTALCQSRYALK